ncbi:MAG: SH3 domain-containing protein [Flavobacteriaceae bacterium]
MRPFFILALCVFIGTLGCKNENTKALIAAIDVHSYENLQYPENSIQFPDSLKNKFIENYFVPWESSSEDLLSSLEEFPGKELSYLKKYLHDDQWYGENKKPHKRTQREEVVNNVDTVTFPNFLKKGITISHTDLRRIPTLKPGFDTYSKAGEGYPFDYFQETMVWANTPVLMVHITKDKQWCYVICPYYKGWVSMRDIAVVDTEFIKQWSSGSFCHPLSDDVSLQHPVSNYAIKAKMGMLLPYEGTPNSSNNVLVYYANADENQNAHILKAQVNKNALAFGDFSFDKKNLTPLVSNLLGKPYGWGGDIENRDCSAMIRDLLGTFRIWLPRDSKDQMATGYTYEFPDATPAKIKLLKEKGVPFLTILRKQGHNMLYVGNAPNGEPLILHAIWGLKTTYSNEHLANLLNTYPIEGIHEDEHGNLKGRHIIGESVITSVHIGDGNNGVTTPLIEEIYAMTNILGK